MRVGALLSTILILSTVTAEVEYQTIAEDEILTGGLEDFEAVRFGEPGNGTLEILYEMAGASVTGSPPEPLRTQLSLEAGNESVSQSFLIRWNVTVGGEIESAHACIQEEEIVRCWIPYETLGVTVGDTLFEIRGTSFFLNNGVVDFIPEVFFFDPVCFVAFGILCGGTDPTYYGENYTIQGCTLFDARACPAPPEGVEMDNATEAPSPEEVPPQSTNSTRSPPSSSSSSSTPMKETPFPSALTVLLLAGLAWTQPRR